MGDVPGQSNDQNEREKGRGFGGFLVWGVLLLVCYVLSIGPAVWVHRRVPNRAIRDAIEIFYTPVVMCCDRSSFGAPIRAYAEWWDR